MSHILVAYIAGALTTLNPCVLPMLPFVLGSALTAGRFGPLALMAGLSFSFTVVGVGIAALGFSLGISPDTIRMAGAIVMLLVGAVLLIPASQGVLATSLGGVANSATGLIDRLDGSSNPGQFATGALLGLVWSPCTGPTLGAAVGLAAQGGSTLSAMGTMFIFSLGMASVMLLLAYGAREAIGRRKAALMAFAGKAKPLFGLMFLIMGASILFGLDKMAEAAIVRAMPDWLVEFTSRF